MYKYVKSVTLQMREFDVIIYGASGVTAQRVIKEINNYDLKVGLAGRSSSKIVYNPKNYPVIQCSIDNIDDLTRKCNIFLNCAGPYIKCGEPVVKSCIEQECHYIDITGETQFIKNIQDKYHKIAEEKGIFILNCAGFDSIPSDISFDLMKQKILNETQGPHSSIEIWNYLKSSQIKINYATWESLIIGLSTYFEKPKTERKRKDRTLPAKFFYSDERKGHCAIFMGTDHSVVTRSQKAYADKLNEPEARFFIYVEIGSFMNKLLFMFFFAMIMIFVKFSLGKMLLLKFPGFFTRGIVQKGISEDEIKDLHFEMNIYGYFKGENNEKNVKKMKVTGPDPGYVTTPICMVTSALVLKDLLEKKAEMEFKGGVVTTSMVFRNTDLVDRLKSRGLKIEFE